MAWFRRSREEPPPSWSEQADKAKAKVGELITEAIGKLIDADEEEDGATAATRGLSVTGGPHWGVIEWLSIALGQLVDAQSEEAQRLSKDLLKAQSTTSELKLQRVRSAAERELQNKSAQIEAKYNAQFEERVSRARHVRSPATSGRATRATPRRRAPPPRTVAAQRHRRPHSRVSSAPWTAPMDPAPWT
jgi:hypothetical protein